MYWTNLYNRMNPLSDVNRLQSELNRLLSDFYPETQRAFPAVNIWTKEDSAFVTAELPGMKRDDLKLSVVEQNIVIEGETKKEILKEGEHYHRKERDSKVFKRSIQLPFPINAGKVSAALTNGVLSIELPRAEEDKPKKIEIKS